VRRELSVVVIPCGSL